MITRSGGEDWGGGGGGEGWSGRWMKVSNGANSFYKLQDKWVLERYVINTINTVLYYT